MAEKKTINKLPGEGLLVALAAEPGCLKAVLSLQKEQEPQQQAAAKAATAQHHTETSEIGCVTYRLKRLLLALAEEPRCIKAVVASPELAEIDSCYNSSCLNDEGLIRSSPTKFCGVALLS